MPLYDLKNSPLLHEKSPAARRFSPLGHLLLFFGVFYASNLLQSVFSSLFLLITQPQKMLELSGAMMKGDNTLFLSGLSELMSTREFLLFSLFCTALTILAVILFVKLVERRRLATIGLRSEYCVRHYLIGLLLGTLLFAGAAGICTLNGAADFSLAKNPDVPWLIAFFLGFAVQGASEELLLRGYFMMSFTENRKSPVFAILFSAILFALMHSENAGFGFLPFVNITLFGIVASVLMLRTNSIVPSLALHTAWNFAEGCLFGTSVSGLPTLPTLLSGSFDEGKSLTNGGTFGPEGGLAVTAVLIVALMIVICIPSNQRRKNSAEEQGEPVA